MIARTFFAAVLLASPALAGPPLTTIQDVLYKADGTRFNGTLAISWSSFQATDNSAIATQITTVKIVNGNLRVQLVPTIGSNPAIVYSVTYNSDGLVQFHETWSVPSSVQPVRLSAVRVATSNLASSDTNGTSSTVEESEVVGLTADLGSRPIKGPGYAPGGVAVVNATGALESATGNSSDCLHVDGSSSPCGGIQAPTFVDADPLSGSVNGANTQFTLAALPNPATSLALYRNGILQRAGQDYTLNGQTVSYVAGATPQPGDTLLAWYRTSTGDGTFSFFDSDSPAGTVDGLNTQFTLVALPNPATSLALYRNGILLKAGFDYMLNGQSLTLVTGATPQSGDTLLARYRLSAGDGTLTFIDSESPSGTVNGVNTQFTLSTAPMPASSVEVFRNGLLQKLGQDYTVNGQTLTFVVGAAPQPGDTLMASYRLSTNGGGSQTVYLNPQVICSGSGTATTAAVLSSLGSCSIPAGLLVPGDRVEVRYDLQHQGVASGFSFEIHWGGTVLGHRDAVPSDTLVAGRADASILSTGAQLNFQSWGAILPFGAGVASAGDVYSSGLTIDFRGMLSSASGDTLALNNFTVVRLP